MYTKLVLYKSKMLNMVKHFFFQAPIVQYKDTQYIFGIITICRILWIENETID